MFAPGAVPTGPSAEDTRLIKEAIARATSLQEIERLNQILRSGAVPGPDVMDIIRSGQPGQSRRRSVPGYRGPGSQRPDLIWEWVSMVDVNLIWA